MSKKFLGGFLVVLLLGSLVIFQARPSIGAEEGILSKEMAQVLANQAKILQGIEEIKGELDKIRMRVH